jgi:hypothetical protein
MNSRAMGSRASVVCTLTYLTDLPPSPHQQTPLTSTLPVRHFLGKITISQLEPQLPDPAILIPNRPWPHPGSPSTSTPNLSCPTPTGLRWRLRWVLTSRVARLCIVVQCDHLASEQTKSLLTVYASRLSMICAALPGLCQRNSDRSVCFNRDIPTSFMLWLQGGNKGLPTFDRRPHG